MNSKTTILLVFLIGAASGGITTWYCVKKKYEELAEEEIASVKEVFAKREKEAGNRSAGDTVSVNHKTQKPDIKEYSAMLHKQGYTRYSDSSVVEEEEETNKPYVIPPEQFGDNEDYSQISLTYYADQVLADENDEMIEDVESMIGFESLSHFGEYEDDSVFVRNDARKCDYEILQDQRLYSDVIKEMPHPMEV